MAEKQLCKALTISFHVEWAGELWVMIWDFLLVKRGGAFVCTDRARIPGLGSKLSLLDLYDPWLDQKMVSVLKGVLCMFWGYWRSK